jgi:outer membrane protein assembly factor BamB
MTTATGDNGTSTRPEAEAPERAPTLLPVSTGDLERPPGEVRPTENPNPAASLGDLGVAAEVGELDGEAVLVLRYEPERLSTVDATSVRVFLVDPQRGFRPVWNSGIVPAFGYVWARVRKPGTYVALGLPRDRLLQEVLRRVADMRRRIDPEDDPDALVEQTRTMVEPLLDDDKALDDTRRLLAVLEIQAGGATLPGEVRYGTGRHPEAFKLPWDASIGEVLERLVRLAGDPRALPEIVLLDPPDRPRDGEPPWDVSAEIPWRDLVGRDLVARIPKHILHLLPWLFAGDWWMYHADERHTGQASGWSDIRASTVHRMLLHRSVPVDGPVYTVPSIVDGKVYVGTSRQLGSGGGTLYRINLATGTVEATFVTTGQSFYNINGIGGSPAVVDGRVYFTTVYGQVYCLDATTFTQLWMQDLKVASHTRRQPVNNPEGDCWSGPVVVDGKVYVGSGEGESELPFGFLWCLDVATGDVRWLYCMNKFVDPGNPGNENGPNVIPRSAAISDPLPAWATAAGFSLHDDPPHKGAAVWSSVAYDEVTNRVFACSGNSRPDNPLPDERYASGVIALDADTGAFAGFFQPAQADSYRPNDYDVDVPCSPTVFSRGGTRVVAFGSKNGSFFLLDAATMQVLDGGARRRQLLPKDAVTGGRIHTVDPTGFDIPTQDSWSGENKWGVMGTAAVDEAHGRIFVGLGGYDGIDDHQITPFVRALDWGNLDDAWPTSVDPVTTGGVTYQVRRYTTARPPLYVTPGEAALSSPAVVNDIVLISTSKSALYALDAATGLCLWSAPGLPAGPWSLGPAVSGNFVVVGAGQTIYVYRLARSRPWWWWFPPLDDLGRPVPWPEPDPWRRGPRPGPDPAPGLTTFVRNAVRTALREGLDERFARPD